MQRGKPWLKWALAAGVVALLVAVVAEISRQTVGPIATAQETMPAIEGTDLSGKKWSVAELKGRPVLVNFFSTT
jgi:cytochrome oxidase Cu insertion factor (SCO1/SenC/PrrC family)